MCSSDLVVLPTCEEQGSKTYIVTFTNEMFENQTYVESIEALGHHYDEGVVSKEPTSEEVGEKTFTCKDCGHSYTEEIEKLPVVDMPVIEPVPPITSLEDVIEQHPVATTFVSVASISLLSVLGFILKFLKIK